MSAPLPVTLQSPASAAEVDTTTAIYNQVLDGGRELFERGEINRGNMTTTVAKHMGKVIGGATIEFPALDPNHPETAELQALAVTEDYRGDGIGTQLVHAALDDAAQRGATSVKVYTDTPQGLGLYPKLGFKKIDGPDASGGVTFKKQLTKD